MEFDVHIAKRVSEDKAKLAAVKASQKPSSHKSGSWAFAFAVVVSDNPMLFHILSSARLHVPLETCSSFCVPMTLATLTSTRIEGHGGPGPHVQSKGYRRVPLLEVLRGYPPNSQGHAHCQPARPSLAQPPAQPPRVPQVGSDRRADILPLGTN
ncbi:hypothetical protein FIBSPDRAFT_1001667 [Athelia psychrophila]|uniref:Uncharacterized protein n=1 Tax=Athelia psychrophila TaxID=1759441 RepID=A0A166QHJ2_9AGAM|nr:hypothetical protein FIBSPDRAFT_1001667 [Fibularhizoctonia sp. CBS 109695]